MIEGVENTLEIRIKRTRNIPTKILRSKRIPYTKHFLTRARRKYNLAYDPHVTMHTRSTVRSPQIFHRDTPITKTFRYF